MYVSKSRNEIERGLLGQEIHARGNEISSAKLNDSRVFLTFFIYIFVLIYI